MLEPIVTIKPGKKPLIKPNEEIDRPYWVEMIQDLVEGAGFSYSRIAYRIKVSPSTIQKLATRWDRKPRHPVFHQLLGLYHKIFTGPYLSKHIQIYLENKMRLNNENKLR